MIFVVQAFGQKHFNSYVSVDAGFTVSFTDIKRYDLVPTTIGVSEIQPGTGFEITYFSTEAIGFNFDFHFYSMAGIDPDLNLTYSGTATLTSLNLSFAFNKLFDKHLRSPWDRRFKAFVKLGYGRFAGSSTLERVNEEVGVNAGEASEIHLGEVNTSVGAMPLEINVMYKLTERHNRFYRETKDRLFLVFSGTAIFTATDQLDNYVDERFSSDVLTYYSVGVAYFFGD